MKEEKKEEDTDNLINQAELLKKKSSRAVCASTACALVTQFFSRNARSKLNFASYLLAKNCLSYHHIL